MKLSSRTCSSTFRLGLTSTIVGSLLSIGASAQPPGSGAHHAGGGGNRLPGQASELPRPSSSVQTPGVIFGEQLEPALVGYTFDYDQQTGSYALRRPLFSATLDDNTGAPDEFRAKFGSVIAGETTYLSDGVFAGIAATLGLAHVAATAASSDTINTSLLSTTFRLRAEADFPMAATNFLGLQQSNFDPTAWAILHMSGDDVARTNAWFDAGFGEFVAFGYDLRGRVDVVFSMTQTSDYRTVEKQFSAMASYSGVTATLDIVTKMKESMETGEFTFSIETQGCTPPHLPTLAEISTQEGQLHYADELNAYASNCKHRVGLYLISAYSLPNGPSLDVPTWSDAVLSQAGDEVHNAIRCLVAASRWNFSPRLAYFLHLQMRSVPNQAQSFDSALLDARDQIATRLGTLRDALIAYGDPANAGNAAVEGNVMTAKNGVHSAVIALQEVLNELEIHMATLPGMQITLTDGMTPTTSGPPFSCQTWVNVQVSNIGLFSMLDTAELEGMLSSSFGPTATILFDEYYGPVYQSHAFSNGGITTVDVLHVQPVAAGPSAGLYTINFDMIVANMSSDSTLVRLRLLDEINRIGVANYNMAN